MGNSKAHTKEEFIDYFDLHVGNFENGIYTPGISPEKWDMGLYRQLMGQCMGCGCPADHSNMNHTDPYYCRICHKKMIGEPAFERLEKKLSKIDEETKNMSTKELMNYTKRKLKTVGLVD